MNEEAPAYIFFNGDFRTLKATRRIRQGETILSLPSTPLRQPDRLSLEICPGVHVDCANSMAGAINHSCNPNAAVKDSRIIAWQCILPGDEIRLDYKRTENKLAEPFDCNCGTKQCRGRIE